MFPSAPESRAPPSHPEVGGAEHLVQRGSLAGVGSAWGTSFRSIRPGCLPRVGGPRPRRVAIFSTRIAAALNSAVPDLGSVASIVSRLTSTCSGKWKVMNASPARSDGSIRDGRVDRAAARRDAHDLAVRDPEALDVLRREVERLAAVERRAVTVRLRPRVERLEPPTRREADRVLVVERLERRLRLDDAERGERPLDRLRPQTAVEEQGDPDPPRPSTATAAPAVLVEPVIGHPTVHRGERTALVPDLLGRRLAPVVPESPRELGDDPRVVARIAGRVERLADTLHAPLAVRHRPLGLAPRGRARQDDVGHLRRLCRDDVLDDEEVEPAEQLARVRRIRLRLRGVLADHVERPELAVLHRLEHLRQMPAVRGTIGVPHAASKRARASASHSMSWKPGSLFGIAPMSPPPCTLFWPRSGFSPEP